MSPLITIITVCRNPGMSIRDTFSSVVNQTYLNVEYIIVDGSSTDGTVEWLNKSEQFDRISVLISEHDSGIYDAINKGISLAKGEVIGILHAGDVFDNFKTLQDICCVFCIDPNAVDVLAGGMRLRYGNSNLGKVIYPSPTAVGELKSRMSLFHPATFITLNAYKKYGFYDSTYLISGDYELLRRFWLAGVRFRLLEQCMIIMQYGGISTQYKHVVSSAKEYSQVLYGNGSSFKRTLHVFITATKSAISLSISRFR